MAVDEEEEVKVDAEEEVAVAPGEDGGALVTAASGLTLHLSGKSATGYKGVYPLPSGRFEARLWIAGSAAHIGTYDTVVEAAVAYAQYVLRTDHDQEDKQDEGDSAREGTLVTQSEGLMLHTSERSSTGYKGVYPMPSGRRGFRAEFHGGQIGVFDTAREAAVAYARHVQSRAHADENAEREAAVKRQKLAQPEEAGTQRPDSTASPALTVAASSSATGSGSGMGLVQKVQRVKEVLQLDASLGLRDAIAEANELMGLTPTAGTALPVQVNCLMQELGVGLDE